MKKIIYNPENPNGIEMDLTAEEIAQKEIDEQNGLAEATARAEAEAQAQADKETKDALKASAKAKLIAGEALTQDEANILIGV